MRSIASSFAATDGAAHRLEKAAACAAGASAAEISRKMSPSVAKRNLMTDPRPHLERTYCRRRSIEQEALALFFPIALVGNCERIEIGRRGFRVVDPFAKQRRAVDDVDGELVEHIFVGEIAPQLIARVKASDRLEGERLKPPRPERS